MSKRTTYSVLGLFVLLLVLFASSGVAGATTFSTPVDADYGDITNSVYLSQDDFPDGAPAAVLTASDNYTTALAATVLAEAAGGPLLFTSSSASFSPSAKAELIRLKVGKVYIIGLPTTIVDEVRAALPSLAADDFVVLSGLDQYENAALIAGQVKALTGETPERVFVVPGDVYGSSLAAAPIAAANGWPILLTPQAGPFPAASAQAIEDLGVTSGVRVDTDVDPGVAGFTVTKTIMGTTSTTDDPGARYSEALDMAKYAAQQGWAVYTHLALGQEIGPNVAYGVNFPINVLLGSHIARQNGAYLLSRSHGLLPSVADLFRQQGKNIESVDFTRPDYSNISSTAWSFAAIRQVKSMNSARVTGLGKTSGPLAGGGALTVTGTGFSEAETVRVGKTDLAAGDWRVDSDTSITIESMPGATQSGATEILVYNYWNVSPSSPSDAYYYVSDSGPDLLAMQAVKEAVKYLGVPYVWGGASPSSFDCSGLTMYVFNKFTTLTGVSLPHRSTYQAGYGTPVSKDDLLPGDLVFFGSPISHVGIYVGNGLMINSPRSGDLVCIEDAYRTSYTTARRLISPYTRIQQTSPLLAYTGAWTLDGTSTSASGGSYGYADSDGASVTVTFNGTYLRWISKVSTAYGIAKVTVDGADAGTVNLYSSVVAYQRKVWDTGTLPNGRHTVTISWTGVSGGGDTSIGLDAFDVFGSFEQAQPAAVSSRYQDTDRRVVYSGLWGNVATTSASGGCFRYISANGSAGITFEGTAVAWLAAKSPASGIGRVVLDGAEVGTVDLYSSSAGYLQKVWSANGLDEGTHTLRVEWTGEKNAASSGTSVNVDAFDVAGTLVTPSGLTRVEQTDSRLTYAGPWGKYSTASASDGSYTRTNSAGSVTVHFNGTYLSWVATTGTTLSKAKVSLDGGATQTIDLARPAVAYQQSVWATGLLEDGEHTVVISWDGGNATGKYVSVDAFDVIGTLTSGGPTPSSATRYEQGASKIVKSGTWSNYLKTAASGGSYGRSATKLASATVTFTGTRLDWIAMKGITTGVADIYLDNVKVATIDLAASTATYQVTIWSSGTLANGPHTFKIVRGTSSGPTEYLTLDAVDIWETTQ